jgi:hypothetical protein
VIARWTSRHTSASEESAPPRSRRAVATISAKASAMVAQAVSFASTSVSRSAAVRCADG